jgi:hypothetical protein
VSRTVFVLGAGASRTAGAPLMSDFVEAAESLHRAGEVFEYVEDFDLVFKARQALMAVHMKSVLDLDNVESLFGAFEMARLIGRFGALGTKELDRLVVAMRRVIALTLERRIEYPAHLDRVWPPRPYNKFIEVMSEMRGSNVGPVSVITFNYDVALDYAFHFNSLPIDYCLTESEPPARRHTVVEASWLCKLVQLRQMRGCCARNDGAVFFQTPMGCEGGPRPASSARP